MLSVVDSSPGQKERLPELYGVSSTAVIFMSYRPGVIYDLSRRVALVTGGGTGIGLMIAQGLASSGSKVYITGRRLEVLQKVADAWSQNNEGGTIIPYAIPIVHANCC